MKGNEKIIRQLNVLLSDELIAINQYIIHAEMCANWGYTRLHDAAQKRAIDEMKHAEKLIARILFLEGIPGVGNLSRIRIGSTVKEQFQNDLDAEKNASKMYNDSIRMAMDLGDNGTADLLRENLLDEEKHLDWLETQLGLIKQIDMKNFLLEQVD